MGEFKCDSSGTSELLQTLIDEVRNFKKLHSDLERKMDTLNLTSGSSSQSDSHRLNLSYLNGHEKLHRSPKYCVPVSLPPSGLPSTPITSPSDSTRENVLQCGVDDISGETGSPESPAASDFELKATFAKDSHEIEETDFQYMPLELAQKHIAYPDKTDITPIPLKWASPDPLERGPIIASRHPKSISVRNSIGAYSGSYSVYKALATVNGTIDPDHRPDFTDTEPTFEVKPNSSWFDPTKIVSMDPWGHLAPHIYKEHIDKGHEIRPTVACTKSHLELAEFDEAVYKGRLPIDGQIVSRSAGWDEAVAVGGEQWASDRARPEIFKRPKVEVAVSKAAVEPVWYLPGIAARFGVSEDALRLALYEDTGGMYPELLTRSDLKTYLPPIGGVSVYIFGDPAFVSDPRKELTLRIHDECNGSDVFGSSECTCRPYLLYGVEEAIKCAQRGGSGLVIYFRKEGRALGEVMKYLVYNARKRGGDSAAIYFKSAEAVAGTKDVRFQELMPDVLHWLGVKKIDVMCSMSDMKHDAIVRSGIPILLRKDIPDHLIPSDSNVEINAKIAAGYFSASKVVTEADLRKTVGREWNNTSE